MDAAPRESRRIHHPHRFEDEPARLIDSFEWRGHRSALVVNTSTAGSRAGSVQRSRVTLLCDPESGTGPDELVMQAFYPDGPLSLEVDDGPGGATRRDTKLPEPWGQISTDGSPSPPRAPPQTVCASADLWKKFIGGSLASVRVDNGRLFARRRSVVVRGAYYSAPTPLEYCLRVDVVLHGGKPDAFWVVMRPYADPSHAIELWTDDDDDA